jgi:hypothetical protein
MEISSFLQYAFGFSIFFEIEKKFEIFGNLCGGGGRGGGD